jgi:hypothetical protein
MIYILYLALEARGQITSAREMLEDYLCYHRRERAELTPELERLWHRSRNVVHAAPSAENPAPAEEAAPGRTSTV